MTDETTILNYARRGRLKRVAAVKRPAKFASLRKLLQIAY